MIAILMSFWSLISAIFCIIFNLWLFYRQEKIKSVLKKSEFVHELQFKKEFELYSEIWNKINGMASLMHQVNSGRPQPIHGMGLVESDLNRIYQLEELNSIVDKILFANQPFIFESVFNPLSELNKLVYRSVKRINDYYFIIGPNPGIQYTDEFMISGIGDTNQFNELADKICKGIRNRINVSDQKSF